MDGLVGSHAACGGIFKDIRGNLLACFVNSLGALSVFESEIYGYMLAMEHAV